MFELVLSVCFVADPARCKDVKLSYMEEKITPQQCMMTGQSEIAKWAEGNPNWRIEKWTCGRAKQVAKI